VQAACERKGLTPGDQIDVRSKGCCNQALLKLWVYWIRERVQPHRGGCSRRACCTCRGPARRVALHSRGGVRLVHTEPHWTTLGVYHRVSSSGVLDCKHEVSGSIPGGGTW
jgi:hypothetical protein